MPIFHHWRLIVMLALVWPAAACAGRARSLVTPSAATFGFQPASHLLSAERDVQWVGQEPHCILRLVLAGAPQSTAVYAEAPREWCSGID